MALPGNRLWYLSLGISALLNALFFALLTQLEFPASRFSPPRSHSTIRVEAVVPPQHETRPRLPVRVPASKPLLRQPVRPANPLPPAARRRPSPRPVPAAGPPKPIARSGGSHGGGGEGAPAPVVAETPGSPPPEPAVINAPVLDDITKRPDHLPPIPAYASEESPPFLEPDLGGSVVTAKAPEIGAGAGASGTAAGSGPGTGAGRGSGPGAGHGAGSTAGMGAGNGTGAGGGLFGVGAGTGAGAGPRHIVYLLDVSPSMESRIDRARQELRNALATLQPGESFDVVAFSGGLQPFEHTLTPVTPETIAGANRFLDSVKLSPATNLEHAVKAVLGMRGVNVVVIITDGVPTVGEPNFDKLAREIDNLNRNRARIFTVGLVGIDPGDPTAPDPTFHATRLLEQIARDNNGSFRLIPLGVPDRG